MYPLPHLKYSHDTGVVDFTVETNCCKRLLSYLEHPDNKSDNGWLLLAGREFPGYAQYPYVHSPLGQIATVQEVCANHTAVVATRII